MVWFLGGDGQITGIDVLPVIDRRLRADLKKRGFARNREAGFTGRFEKTEICP
ncbi:vitamin B12-binding protein [Ligilactobacillus ruminis]|uniref:vitamin B12-binding protein n=1 Tax=Ligilactobacillus ruminis TaxID=1623 RepID=UPI003B9A7479